MADGFFGGLANAAAGAARGYEATKLGQPQQQQPPAQPQQRQGFAQPMMDYIRSRKARQQMGQGGAPPGAMDQVAQASQQMQQQTPLAPPPQPPPGMGSPGLGAPNNPMGGSPDMQMVDKPTTALLGADGPEAVVPLNGRPDAMVTPGAMFPRMQYNRRG